MAYLKPPAFVRVVFNRIAKRTGVGGAVTVIVAGRRTGAPREVPVTPVDHDGARYLVSARGETEWVRNLRAAGGQLQIRSKGSTESVTATEVPVGERGPILDAYRKKAGKAVSGLFKKLPDDADHPTFRIEAG